MHLIHKRSFAKIFIAIFPDKKNHLPCADLYLNQFLPFGMHREIKVVKHKLKKQVKIKKQSEATAFKIFY